VYGGRAGRARHISGDSTIRKHHRLGNHRQRHHLQGADCRGRDVQVHVDPKWSYDGKPIIVSIFDRTDDPVRHAYDGYLQAQLQAVGFQVNLIPGTLATAVDLRLRYRPGQRDVGHLPSELRVHLQYYDEGFAELYAPIAGAIPASSNEGPAFRRFQRYLVKGAARHGRTVEHG
jgi:hypothetical protein